ncbi:MAG: hypothetical protein CM15mP64_5540 [Candidatus Neomarinimicrobiota bacterium]|nr:MAG: hypothetical protein CM15mP64_5540 [Candidatus Neomarinimicrobiota bacterium]
MNQFMDTQRLVINCGEIVENGQLLETEVLVTLFDSYGDGHDAMYG